MHIITIARKPTVVANVLTHGCGATAIDAIRVRSKIQDSERRVSQPGGGSVGGIYGAMTGSAITQLDGSQPT